MCRKFAASLGSRANTTRVVITYPYDSWGQIMCDTRHLFKNATRLLDYIEPRLKGMARVTADYLNYDARCDKRKELGLDCAIEDITLDDDEVVEVSSEISGYEQAGGAVLMLDLYRGEESCEETIYVFIKCSQRMLRDLECILHSNFIGS